MNKKKVEILVFVLIVFVAINYGVYNYVLLPYEDKVVEAKEAYQAKILLQEQKENEKAEYESLKAELEEMANYPAELDELTAEAIDTPQLIYDFYNYCKKYEVNGGELVFDLAGVQLQSENGELSSVNQEEQETKKVLKMTIGLTADGETAKMDKFLRNLNSITDRKINVFSIELTADTTESVVLLPDDLVNTEPEYDEDGNPVSQDLTDIELPDSEVTKNLEANIVFYQYIMLDSEQADKLKTYDFYHEDIGFDSIEDLFN
ncbi:MAG: hypothetical protein ACERKV_00325 [Clostridiaceae bacterium]